MKLLEILLERPGEVVSREELRGRVWTNESFGDFDQALNIAIAKLRSALEDSAENPRFIETLPKRGYRFIADVSVVNADAHPKKPASSAGELPGSQEEEERAGHETQRDGLTSDRCAQTPAVADESGHRCSGAGPEFVHSRSLAISFAWPCPDGHPIPGGASPREPLWRCFARLLRRRHDRRADNGSVADQRFAGDLPHFCNGHTKGLVNLCRRSLVS